MAVNLLPPCDLMTSWYHFTYPLSWSDSCEVAQVLSDIPFISVGVLVFGVSVLFIVSKRVSLSAVWLFFSALLAFVATVLDLAHTSSMTLEGSQPAIRAREVLLAFSTGLRFMFYWSYVAEPPLKTRCAASTQSVRRFKIFTFESTQEPKPHSGSWMRWGLLGRLLGASLLAAIIIVTALQIVWRVVPQFHQYSNAYATDAALELLVSFFLLLKLLSTVALDSSDTTLVHTFRECFAPIFGLLVNIATGVGNLLYFAFTESTVGRLLQAFEVFVIAVFVVITALLSHRHILPPTTSSQDKAHRDAMFTLPKLPRESTFRLTSPIIETPRMSSALGFATRNRELSREVLHRSARRSLNQVSSWVSPRVLRSRRHHEDEKVRLWNCKETEVEPGGTITRLRTSIVSSTHEPKEQTEPIHDASANHMAVISAFDEQSETAQSTEVVIGTNQTVHPHRADVPQRAVPVQARASFVHIPSVLPSATLKAKHAVSATPPPDASPVYGLGGIQSLTNTSDLRTSLEELLSQQSQLDRSIEALKLFGTRTPTDSSPSSSVLDIKSVKLTHSSSIGQKTTCSDVSLSSFPIPPWLTTPVSSLASPPMMRIREERRVHLAAAGSNPIQDTYGPVSLETLAPLVDTPNALRSSGIPRRLSVKTNEHLPPNAGSANSEGTRYNVTSFLGITLGEPGQGGRKERRQPAESKSSPSMKKLPPLPASPTVADPSSLARPSRLSQGDVDASAVMRHRINDQTPSSLAMALSPQTHVMGCGEEGMSLSPIRPPSVQITGSPIAMSAEDADRRHKTFVRPRPPPLTLRFYGTSRIQVVGDD